MANALLESCWTLCLCLTQSHLALSCSLPMWPEPELGVGKRGTARTNSWQWPAVAPCISMKLALCSGVLGPGSAAPGVWHSLSAVQAGLSRQEHCSLRDSCRIRLHWNSLWEDTSLNYNKMHQQLEREKNFSFIVFKTRYVLSIVELWNASLASVFMTP